MALLGPILIPSNPVRGIKRSNKTSDGYLVKTRDHKCCLMKERKNEYLSGSGLNRREFLKGLSWAATGTIFAFSGGVARAITLGNSHTDSARDASFSFVHLSDSHIGFSQEPNRDPAQTLRAAQSKINGLDSHVDILIHTGDLTHNSRSDEFDTFDQIIKGVNCDQRCYVPGERDALDGGGVYRSRYGKNAKGTGWYSFDHKGVHFIGLVNLPTQAGGLGTLGNDQIRWLEQDLAALKESTPIVVFSHYPLWMASKDWGWGTVEGPHVLELLHRFGSVTALNGHVHQSMQKVEGNILFHSARSTAYPQLPPGVAPRPEPEVVEAKDLRSLLGFTSAQHFANDPRLAMIDTSLRFTESF